jgi:hypothetical protein
MSSCNSSAPPAPAASPLESGTEILGTSGDVVFKIDVPPGSGQVNITQVDISTVPDANRIFSTVIDVKLVDENNNIIPLDGDARLCFEATESYDFGCLAYLDEDSNTWKCEDSCLDIQDNLLCGTTTHFSTFALLLTGLSDGCDSGLENEILYILSSISIAIAIVTFLVCAVVADYRVRKNNLNFDREVSSYNWKIEENHVLDQ